KVAQGQLELPGTEKKYKGISYSGNKGDLTLQDEN
nr:P-cadherin - mouse (fragments) [Mus musculus]